MAALSLGHGQSMKYSLSTFCIRAPFLQSCVTCEAPGLSGVGKGMRIDEEEEIVEGNRWALQWEIIPNKKQFQVPSDPGFSPTESSELTIQWTEWLVFLPLLFVSRTGSFCCGYTFPFIAACWHPPGLLSASPTAWELALVLVPCTASVRSGCFQRGNHAQGPPSLWATVCSRVTWSWMMCFWFCLCHFRCASVVDIYLITS